MNLNLICEFCGYKSHSESPSVMITDHIVEGAVKQFIVDKILTVLEDINDIPTLILDLLGFCVADQDSASMPPNTKVFKQSQTSVLPLTDQHGLQDTHCSLHIA